MNELLSEIIYRCNLSSNEQIENLWKKTNNGGKWAFGKVIVEINSTQPTFPVRVLERSKVDKVLAGTILEFCARYLSLIALLEKHDRERVFLNIIETGIFGKVFSILAPLSDEVKRTREYNPPRPQAEDPRPLSVFPPALELGAEKEPLAAKLNPFKKKPPEEPHLEEPVDKDPFSLALEKSFGPSVSVEPKEEPLLSVSVEQTKVEERIEPGFSNTQQALDNLKKEWEEIKAFGPEKEEPKAEAPAPKAQEIVEESLSYPFAGWTNEENYKK